MSPLEHSTALIAVITDDALTSISCTWQLPPSKQAVLRADIAALLTRTVLTAPLLVKPIEGDGEL